MIGKTWNKLILSLAFALLTGCGSSSDDSSTIGGPGNNRGDLVSANALGSNTAATIAVYLTALGISGSTQLYDVNCFALTYKTPDVNGNLINASGLICVPQKSAGASSPLLSFQHGTIVTDAEAPSSSGSDNFKLGQGFAALGYVAILPDYIGYSASTDQLHPYVHAATLASATIDSIRAARTYLRQQGISTNGKLFVTGYSEGGYATMAAQKTMEQDFAGEFPLTASVPAAGPYDLSNTSKTLLAPSVLVSPLFVSFFIKAYDTIYDHPSRISELFRPPYDSVVNTAFDGSKDEATIKSMLTNQTAVLFNEPFLSNFRGSGETTLKADIAQNDIYAFQPKTPTRLFHGANDDTVPYANSVTAANFMQPSGNVQLVNCDAGPLVADHTNCVEPYLRYMVDFFSQQNPGL